MSDDALVSADKIRIHVVTLAGLLDGMRKIAFRPEGEFREYWRQLQDEVAALADLLPENAPHLSDDDSEAEAEASEQLAQFREGDVLPSWGDRPLTAREAAALNERPDDVATATGDDLRELARTDHAAFLASLNLRVDEWIELMGSGTPEGDAELSRFAVAVLREDNVDPGQMVDRLRRARQRYRGDPGFRAYVDQVAAEWEPPGDQSSDRSEP